MISLERSETNPLRIYIRGQDSEIIRLITSLTNRFYREKRDFDRDEDKDIDNIIFENEGEHYFPSGLLSIVVGELELLSIPYTMTSVDTAQDFEIPEVSADLLDGITLREYQVEAIKAAFQSKRGLLSLPTGSGKSEIMIAISKILQEGSGNILVCVPTATLLHQTYDRMVERGIPAENISKYGDGNKIDISKRIVISTVSTAYRRLPDEEFSNWYKDLKCIILDEAQHGACRTWYTLIDAVCPEYIIGVSAEPFYGDDDHVVRDLVLRGTVGPVLYRVPLNYLIDKGYLSKPYMIAIDSQYKGNLYRVMDWHTVNKSGIINNKLRNQAICDIACTLIDMSKNPLILVQQINHGKTLAELVSSKGYRVAILTGGLKVSIYVDGREVDTYKDSDNQVKDDFQKGVYDVLIGTSVLDEGADIPALSSVILAGGSKSKLRLIQRIGRGLRKKEGDNTTFIIDFQDRFSIVLHSHHKKRKQLFIDHNIPVYYCSDLSQLPAFFQGIIEQRKRELASQGS